MANIQNYKKEYGEMWQYKEDCDRLGELLIKARVLRTRIEKYEKQRRLIKQND